MYLPSIIWTSYANIQEMRPEQNKPCLQTKTQNGGELTNIQIMLPFRKKLAQETFLTQNVSSVLTLKLKANNVEVVYKMLELPGYEIRTFSSSELVKQIGNFLTLNEPTC